MNTAIEVVREFWRLMASNDFKSVQAVRKLKEAQGSCLLQPWLNPVPPSARGADAARRIHLIRGQRVVLDSPRAAQVAP